MSMFDTLLKLEATLDTLRAGGNDVVLVAQSEPPKIVATWARQRGVDVVLEPDAPPGMLYLMAPPALEQAELA